MFELQQRGILQAEQRQPRHQMITSAISLPGSSGICANIRRARTAAPHTEVFAAERCTHINTCLAALDLRQYIELAAKVYEELFS